MKFYHPFFRLFIFSTCLLPANISAQSGLATNEDQGVVSDAGYELTVPAGWVFVNEVNSDDVRPEVEQAYQDAARDFRMAHLDFAAFDPKSIQNLSTHFTVVRIDGGLELSEASLTDYADDYRGRYSGNGDSVIEFKSEIVGYANGRCFLIEMLVNSQGDELYQRAYIIPGVDCRYFIWCSALAADRADASPAFDRVFTTFSVSGMPRANSGGSVDSIEDVGFTTKGRTDEDNLKIYVVVIAAVLLSAGLMIVFLIKKSKARAN